MTDSLRNSVENLRKLSPKLNEATDSASRVVGIVETFLNDECSIGIPQRIAVSTDENGTGLWLGYERCGSRFRIAVVHRECRVDEEGNRFKCGHDYTGNPEYEMEDHVVPWTDANRGDKLKTFAELPNLLKSLEKTVSDAIKSVETTSDAVEQIKEAMNPTQPTKPAGRSIEELVLNEEILKKPGQSR